MQNHRSFINLAFTLAGAVLISACDTEETNTPDPILVEGESIVKANCKVCHAQGINGAPILGNNKMWGERKTKGKDTLVQSAINGFGLMPAKGGNTDLTQEEIEKAVTYMLSLVKE